MRVPTPTRLLLIAVLVVTASTQAVFLMGASFVQIGREFDLGPVGLGALTAGFFLTASAASPPLGRWVGRVGWQRAMIINARVSAAVLLLIAAAARDAWSLAVLLVAAAAMYGAANPAANQALADHTDPARRATIFGVKHAGIPGSTLLAGLAVPVLVVQVGWRWAYVAAAGLAIGVSFLVPRAPVPVARRAPEAAHTTTGEPLALRHLLVLALGSAFATWGAVALATFLVSAAVEIGYSEGAAGTLLFIGSAASIAARVGYGALTDRFGRRGFVAFTTLTLAGSMAFFFLPGAVGIAFGVLVIAAFATGWAWPGLMTYTVVYANPRSVASSSAITQAGVFLGAGLGPLLLGAVIDRWSFDGAWTAAAIGLVVASAIVASVGVRTAEVRR